MPTHLKAYRFARTEHKATNNSDIPEQSPQYGSVFHPSALHNLKVTPRVFENLFTGPFIRLVNS